MSQTLSFSLSVARRILREFGRSRRVLLLWGLFPAVMLVLFGWVRAGDEGFGPAFAETAPGILVGAALFFSCLGGPISILAGERERRTLRRLLLTPLPGSAYFLGIVWAHVAIAFGQVAIVYGLTFAVGGGFEGPKALGVLILLLSVASYVGVGFYVGAKLAGVAEDVNGVVAAIGVPLLVLGGTFFASDRLPPVLYVVAHANPIFHMNEAFKTVAFGLGGLPEVGANVAALAMMAIATVALGTHAYRSLLQKERSA
jgi:ABC-2 type transport system permease protein